MRWYLRLLLLWLRGHSLGLGSSVPCYSPWVPAGSSSKRPVRCGQCRGCRLEYSRQWAVRIMHEAQMHESNVFVTLTYKEVE